MGGGGGYFAGRDVDRHVRNVQASGEDDPGYDVEVNEYLRNLLSDFNDRDEDSIQAKLEKIRSILDRGEEDAIELRYGGSIAKHTYVDGLSDVDALVLLADPELVEAGPDAAKEQLYTKLTARLPHLEITEGRLAVTVTFDDTEIQLVPAVRDGDRYRIANLRGGGWASIDPKGFAGKLTDVNQSKAGKVVPVVKLAKALIAQMPDNQQVSGYHAEALAVDVFKGYEGRLTPRDMLKYYFRAGSQRILEPIRDSTGQSIHVDDDLGDSGSLARQVVSSGFARVARRMELADAGSRVDDWRTLFGEL